MTYGTGSPEASLSEAEIRKIIIHGIPASLYTGKRILVLTPDTTRTCPLPLMISILQDSIGSKANTLDFMVAPGPHTPLSEERILTLYGISATERASRYKDTLLLNYRWDLPDTLTRAGWIEPAEIEELSEGRLSERVPVDINRTILEYDLILIPGPVFLHESVGYSGGVKYLLPGISGGDYLEAWSQAADLSEQVHVVRKDAPYHTVFEVCPAMYDEIWTGGKVMHKLEQLVADNGRLITYAPHITEVSRTWRKSMEKIGYQVRDYFFETPDRFTDTPRDVLAHSTHVRDIGTMKKGCEKPRIKALIASAIPEKMCRKISPGYLDPATVNPDDYRSREDEGILFVEKAGEILHRLTS